MYELLMKMCGEDCYTLTQDKPAKMFVGEQGIEIVYPTVNSKFIPRSMVTKAINQLKHQRKLTVQDVHEGITNRNGSINAGGMHSVPWGLANGLSRSFVESGNMLFNNKVL